MKDTRFFIRNLPIGVIYVLQVRESCVTAIAQHWLTKKGIDATFKLRGWWYEASWENSPQAEAIAPLLQAGSPWDFPEPDEEQTENPTRNPIPYPLIAGIAAEFGCVECWWRESDRSFTGFVAEVWFNTLPSEFASKWAAVVGYEIRVRRRQNGPAQYAVSIPCVVAP
jgi:hypothetical protein